MGTRSSVSRNHFSWLLTLRLVTMVIARDLGNASKVHKEKHPHAQNNSNSKLWGKQIGHIRTHLPNIRTRFNRADSHPAQPPADHFHYLPPPPQPLTTSQHPFKDPPFNPHTFSSPYTSPPEKIQPISGIAIPHHGEIRGTTRMAKRQWTYERRSTFPCPRYERGCGSRMVERFTAGWCMSNLSCSRSSLPNCIHFPLPTPLLASSAVFTLLRRSQLLFSSLSQSASTCPSPRS